MVVLVQVRFLDNYFLTCLRLREPQEESDVTTRKWAYNPSIGVLGYGAIPYEGRTIILFYFIFFMV